MNSVRPDERTLRAILNTSLQSIERRVRAAEAIKAKLAPEAACPLDEQTMEEMLERITRFRIGVIGIEENDYPSLLLQSPAPPRALYYRGARSRLNGARSIAVVGARKADLAGCDLASDFGEYIALTGNTCVSGLALGIDGSAHRGALRCEGGHTIAVLAHGLDMIYPTAHESLAERILDEGGIILSEYAPTTIARPHHFLERNRIIAGLSEGVVLIQAGERSGALATARYALEANRDVWVAPGSIRDPRYRGSNSLIEDGAVVVSSPLELPIVVPASARKNTLDPDQVLILNLVSSGSERVADLTRQWSGKGDLLTALLSLEESGVVERLPGDRIRVRAGLIVPPETSSFHGR